MPYCWLMSCAFSDALVKLLLGPVELAHKQSHCRHALCFSHICANSCPVMCTRGDGAHNVTFLLMCTVLVLQAERCGRHRTDAAAVQHCCRRVCLLSCMLWCALYHTVASRFLQRMLLAPQHKL
jgi:hypothetical protein